MDAKLKRKIGPFQVWQWLLIVVLGLLLGYLVRRRIEGSTTIDRTPVVPIEPGFGGSEGASNGSGGGQIDSSILVGQLAEQNRILDSLGTDLFAGIRNLFADTNKRIDKIRIVGDANAKPRPTVIKDPKTVANPDTAIEAGILKQYATAGQPRPSASRLARHVQERKAGRSEADILYELRKYLFSVGKGPNPGADPQAFIPLNQRSTIDPIAIRTRNDLRK